MNEWLKFKKNNSIAILSLNRPDIRNPLGEPEDAENFEEAREVINNDREYEPIIPEYVLFGLILVNFLPPNIFPNI